MKTAQSSTGYIWPFTLFIKKEDKILLSFWNILQVSASLFYYDHVKYSVNERASFRKGNLFNHEKPTFDLHLFPGHEKTPISEHI